MPVLTCKIISGSDVSMADEGEAKATKSKAGETPQKWCTL